jgi:hypothetical protein
MNSFIDEIFRMRAWVRSIICEDHEQRATPAPESPTERMAVRINGLCFLVL